MENGNLPLLLLFIPSAPIFFFTLSFQDSGSEITLLNLIYNGLEVQWVIKELYLKQLGKFSGIFPQGQELQSSHWMSLLKDPRKTVRTQMP